MAKPSTAPVADNCADPTCTGGICGPAVLAIKEALAFKVPSSTAVRKGVIPGCRGSAKVSGSTPAGSPKRFNFASALVPLLLTRVKEVVQFSLAARCGSDPIKLLPGIEGSMVREPCRDALAPVASCTVTPKLKVPPLPRLMTLMTVEGPSGVPLSVPVDGSSVKPGGGLAIGLPIDQLPYGGVPLVALNVAE